MKRIASALGYSLLIAAGASALRAQDVVVIANPSVKSVIVSTEEVKDVFSGSESAFKDGSKVVPVTLKDGPVQTEFLKTYLGKSDAAFKAAWRKLVFTGQASMPKALDSDDAMVSYVASTPGAVGYISKAALKPGVKTLFVK